MMGSANWMTRMVTAITALVNRRWFYRDGVGWATRGRCYHAGRPDKRWME